MSRFFKKLIGAFQKIYKYTKISTTQNVKGNRKIVVASYTTEVVFKIPDGLDLEDETVVQDRRTKYGKLYITYVNSEDVLEIDSEWDTEIDYKYSSEEVIADADEFHVDYEQAMS